MKKLNSTIKTIVLLVLFTSCASTTMIESVPSGAKVYLDDNYVGETPYKMTDTKIMFTCTYLRLEKDGFEILNTDICRDEEVDIGAVVGGCFVWVPFLWTMKYYPNHTYELQPLVYEENQVPYRPEHQESKYNKLRELKTLLDDGVITEEEFEKEKKKILEED